MRVIIKLVLIFGGFGWIAGASSAVAQTDAEQRAARILKVAERHVAHDNDVMAKKYFQMIVDRHAITQAAVKARQVLGLPQLEKKVADVPPKKDSNEPTESGDGFRDWTSEGKVYRLKMVALVGGTVIFEKEDGTRMLIELDKLSDEDKTFIKDGNADQ